MLIQSVALVSRPEVEQSFSRTDATGFFGVRTGANRPHLLNSIIDTLQGTKRMRLVAPTYEQLVSRLEDCLADRISDAEMGKWAMLGSFAIRGSTWVDSRKDEAALAYFLDLIFKASPEGHEYEHSTIFHQLLHDIKNVLKGDTAWTFKEEVGGTEFNGLTQGEGTMREEIFKMSGLPWMDHKLGPEFACELTILGKEMKVSKVALIPAK